MEQYSLNSTVRSNAGKGVARKLRGTGVLPAVLYGQKHSPVSLEIDESAMKGILREHPESAMVTLSVDGDDVNVIVRDVQRHPATGCLLHVDFQRIRLDEKIRVDVPVQLEGEAVGVKDSGGVLEHALRNMSLMCLPSAVPPAIVLNIAELQVGDTIKVKDAIAIYPGVEFVDDGETTVATVLSPVIDRTAEAAEGAEGELAEGEAPVDEGDAAARSGDSK